MKLDWRGAEAKLTMRQAAVKGLQDGVDFLAEKSQAEVPVSPYARGGFLKSTMEKAVDASQLMGAVGYDGGAVESRRGKGGNLAVLVHERMDVSHSTGNAKYLENPLNENKDEILRRIAAELKKAF